MHIRNVHEWFMSHIGFAHRGDTFVWLQHEMKRICDLIVFFVCCLLFVSVQASKLLTAVADHFHEMVLLAFALCIVRNELFVYVFMLEQA